MTHDKVRQDFEARKIPHLNLKKARDGSYYYAFTSDAFRDFFDGYQAGRAAERAEIREKLESHETEYEVAYSLRGLGWKDNAERAKAAITKILEVI